MPYCSPHRSVPPWLSHRKSEYIEHPYRETDQAHCLLALKHNSKTCKLDEAGDSLVRVAMTQLNLSALADHCIFKLARTIAELTGGKKIQSAHLADALQYPLKLMHSTVC